MKVHLLYLCLLIFLIVLNGSFLLCLFNGVKMNVDAMKSQYVLFLLLGLVAGFLISYLMFNREEIDMEGAEKIALNYTSAQKSYRSLQLEAGSTITLVCPLLVSDRCGKVFTRESSRLRIESA